MWLAFPQMDTSPGVLLQKFTERMVSDQSMAFTDQQNFTLKAVAVASSFVSINFCLVAIYMLWAMDPKRLVFRHQLIAFLFFYDLLKAVVLLIFPARVMQNTSSYTSNEFCQVVGFFTATATEGADLAILAFAIHIFLLIFKPSLSVKVKRTNHVEGGLYKFRYYVYGLSMVIPLAMASFPFIGHGYQSFVCWCYLPQRPYWYRAAFSWLPRYMIVVIIFTVYASIYIHVLREFRVLGGAFSKLHRQKLRTTSSADENSKPSFFSAFTFFLRDVRAFFFPNYNSTGSKTPGSDADSESTASKSNPESSGDERKPDSPGSPDGSHDLENNLGNADFQAANLESFKKRQKAIEKQMKSVFIYPIAYVSVWVFPFILHCTQISYEEHHGPIVWLNYLGAIIQPLIGFVDSLVFFYRERPWKHTVMRNFEKDNACKLDLVLTPGIDPEDMQPITTSPNKSSLALSMQVDLDKYPKWRRFMSKCRFPLMQLPTDENIAKFQAKHLKKKCKAAKLRANKAREQGQQVNPVAEIDGLQAKHDFSNLLDGSNFTNDNWHKFEGYKLSFNEDSGKPSLNSSNTAGGDRRPSVATISNKSAKSRRVSSFEGHDPIPEDASYVKRNSKVMKQVKCITTDPVDDEGELDLLDFLGRPPK
ncbi:hypothetical protein JCM33374_g1046 [Metschnikowia sp. JCM 33374]|nr:hypothetical protein JCM33374_g1046 [Metschnikowia sp. JCM 33374]